MIKNPLARTGAGVVTSPCRDAVARPGPQTGWRTFAGWRRRAGRRVELLAVMAGLALGGALPALAETNGVSATPAMGWSTWSFLRYSPTEATVEAQAQAMHDSGLQNHGFVYVNLDDFYYNDPSTTVDGYGRWTINTNSFPDGMAAVAAHIHSLGLQFGIYLTPGIPVAAYNQNTPIQGTSLHAQDIVTNTASYEANYNYGNCMYYIDYAQPGAQAFINSWANLLASWGVDYLKIDGVGDGDVGDIEAWSQALVQTGRPIHLELSNSLDVNHGSLWQAYANGWRIDGDIECYCSGTSYPLTDWGNVQARFSDAPNWTPYAGPGGWNDLDSLEIGNGTNDGLTLPQRQAAMTLWCLCCAPLLLGADLTQLDTNDLPMLFNDRVLQIDQAGSVGAPLTYNTTDQVWRAAEPDGSYAVAIFNQGSTAANLGVTWAQLGFTNAAEVQDLWTGTDLGRQAAGYAASVPAAGAMFYRLAPVYPATRCLACAPGNALAGGARTVSSPELSGGLKAGFVGEGGTLTFNNVVAPAAGTYRLTFLYECGDSSRNADISINGGAATQYTFVTSGSWSTLASLTVSATLRSGSNSITLSNPSAYAPDFDSLVVQSPVLAPPPAPAVVAATGGSSQAALTWLASCGASGYVVRYGAAVGSYTMSNLTATAGLTVNLSNPGVYYFVVAATNSAGTSAGSAVSVLIGPPSAPASLAAAAGIVQVGLQWNASFGAASYNLARSTVSGGPYTVITNVMGTNYTDTAVANGTTYYYVVAAVAGAGNSTNSAQVSATPSLANGTYIINSRLSALALDAPGGGQTGVDQQPYTGTNQQWKITAVGGGNYEISAANGHALSGPTQYAPLVLTNYTGAAWQLWNFQASGPGFTLRNAGNGQVLDDTAGGLTAGNTIGQWSANGGANQNWCLTQIRPATSVSNGTYIITCQQSGLALDDPYGGETGVDQQPYSGLDEQWRILAAGGGSYEIITANGCALAGPTPDAQLVVTNYTGAAWQLWNFQASGSGYILQNAGNGQVLDDFNNSSTAGNEIGQWSANGGANQNWTLTAVLGGKITSPVITSLPPVTAAVLGGNSLRLSWPADFIGWRLLIQTNHLSSGISTNSGDWGVLNSSAPTNSETIPVNPAQPSGFYRLVHP